MAQSYNGPWTLKEVADNSRTGIWPGYVPPPPSLSYGWFGGGYGPGSYVAGIDRMDYASDTSNAIARTSFSSGRLLHTAVCNASNIWFAGGSVSGDSLSVIDRLVLTNDTGTVSTRCHLFSKWYGLTGFNNASYGYFGGGNQGTGQRIDKMNFNADTVNAINIASFTGGYYQSAGGAVSNGTCGYFAGGYYSNVDKIIFASDTSYPATVTHRTLVSFAQGAVANNTYGWFGFGRGSGGVNNPTNIERLIFSSDTSTLTIRAAQSAFRYGTSACSSSSDGYFVGGSGNSGYSSNIEKFNHTTDTVMSIVSYITSARYYGAGGVSSIASF